MVDSLFPGFSQQIVRASADENSVTAKQIEKVS